MLRKSRNDPNDRERRNGTYTPQIDTPAMAPDEPRRVAAACAACGHVYAAVVGSDDAIRIIGRPDGCRCGSTEFVLPDESA